MNQPLTPERLAEIAARAVATSGGRWQPYRRLDGSLVIYAVGNRQIRPLFAADQATAADTEFAAHAHEDVRDLLAELDRVRSDRDRYRSCWQSARGRAAAYGEGILRVVGDRESYQGWLKTAEEELVNAKTENAAFQKRLHDAAMTKTWTNEDGKKFVFVEDLAPPLLGLDR